MGFRFPMSGGVNRDMGIGVPAWKSIPFVEMVYTTRYVCHPSHFSHAFFSCVRVGLFFFFSWHCHIMLAASRNALRLLLLHSKINFSDYCQHLSKSSSWQNRKKLNTGVLSRLFLRAKLLLLMYLTQFMRRGLVSTLIQLWWTLASTIRYTQG